jgi:hypothetical protein
MTCQLCYRATDGTPVYGTPVSSGACSLRLDKAPNKNVIIAVICNTDYRYMGDSTRKAHYDYRLKLGAGVTGAADIYTKWYNVTLSDAPTVVREDHPRHLRSRIATGESAPGGRSLIVAYDVRCASPVTIALFTATGELIASLPTRYQQPGRHSERVDFDRPVAPGMYFVKLTAEGGSKMAKAAIGR